MKNLRHKIKALDKESVKQAELIYNAEYEIQLMERKLSVVKGERSDAEKKALTAQIEKCKEELKEAKDQQKFLVNQTRKVNNEYTRARRREEEAERDKVKLRERINTVEMESNAVELDLKQYTEEEQEAMVSNDVMRLEIKRLRDQLSERADKVFTLENRQWVSRPTKKGAVHSDVQGVQLRLAEEEVHKVKMEVNRRKAQINMLATKYEKGVESSSVPRKGGNRSRKPIT